MLAIGINKPRGYHRSINKAKAWLLSQQNEVGCWHIDGGPSIMINILCLEAIKLAEGDDRLTYSIDSEIVNNESNSSESNLSNKGYIIFCEGEQGGKNNKSFDERFCCKNFFVYIMLYFRMRINILHLVFIEFFSTESTKTVFDEITLINVIFNVA